MLLAITTSSRADYCHLRWPLHELHARPGIAPVLIATGALLHDDFGAAADIIEQDGFTIDHRIDCLDDDDTDLGMARALGRATLAFADLLAEMRPDLLLVIADRYEMLAPAGAALTLRIPIAHVEGGDISEGAIDQAVRDALTKMSHLHFTPTEAAAQRVIAMGEESWRVHHVGAPSLDHLHRSTLLDRASLEHRLGLTLRTPTVVVAHHPVTLHDDTTDELDAVLHAIDNLDAQLLFCHPNADAGGRAIAERLRTFCDAHDHAHLIVNLDPVTYWSLLSHADAMLGNSSSGIMESPSLKLPAVDIGDRQQGRRIARNTINVPADTDDIRAALHRALDPTFRSSLDDLSNPYGDGHASERIADVIANVEISRLLGKRIRSEPPHRRHS